MKHIFSFILLSTIYSCGPSYCDGCVETEHTITSTTGLEDLFIYSANMVTEFDTYYKIGIGTSEEEWNSTSFRMYKGNTTLIDQKEEIQLELSSIYVGSSVIYMDIPIEGIEEDGNFPEGEVFFEGTLSSDEHEILFTGSTHFYVCENVFENFDRVDCRFSCQMGSIGLLESPCNGQLCPL